MWRAVCSHAERDSGRERNDQSPLGRAPVVFSEDKEIDRSSPRDQDPDSVLT